MFLRYLCCGVVLFLTSSTICDVWTYLFHPTDTSLGILVSFVSIFWTWGGGARLSRRLLRSATSRIQAANMVRRAIRVGVSLNLLGMMLTLLGAEQTVGYLAIKVLTARPWGASPMPMAFAPGDGTRIFAKMIDSNGDD